MKAVGKSIKNGNWIEENQILMKYGMHTDRVYNEVWYDQFSLNLIRICLDTRSTIRRQIEEEILNEMR